VQLRQRLERLGFVRIDLEHRLPGPHGLLVQLERVLVEHRDPFGDRLALVEVAGDLQVALEDLDQLARAVDAGEQPLEREEGVQPLGHLLERRAPGLDGVRGAAQRRLEDLGRHGPQLRLQIGIDRLDGALLERRGQRRVQPGGGGQGAHLGQRLGRLDVGEPGAAAALEGQV
jgi:hypothetical protein